jgi:hypothetical protein
MFRLVVAVLDVFVDVVETHVTCQTGLCTDHQAIWHTMEMMHMSCWTQGRNGKQERHSCFSSEESLIPNYLGFRTPNASQRQLPRCVDQAGIRQASVGAGS